MAQETLSGKTVVITGASSGFGRGSAIAMARNSASVVLAARRDQVLDELARECESLGGEALAVATDVCVPEDVERLAGEAIGRFGQIDVWVNNAGAGAVGRFEEVPLEDHEQVIATDLLGTIYGSWYAMRHFRHRGEGILINIASVIGKVPSPYYASYAAAKHGVVGLSAALRQELRQADIERIRVCTVIPTSFDTPFFEHAAARTGRQVKPIPPVYDPNEVVDTIVKLARDPEDEVTVGTAATVTTFLHSFMPGLVERMMGRQTRKAEFDEAAPGPEHSGSLHEPMPEGTGVHGGWKKE